uniref:Uncharacterized protein n=1 Tax=Arundo donax TaxID=35708 RepID=A0A0A8ZR03_ARUDO
MSIPSGKHLLSAAFRSGSSL